MGVFYYFSMNQCRVDSTLSQPRERYIESNNMYLCCIF
ncbi:hypothetical protein AALP_AA1G337700 [Arabis alpina]|uniref:Uncharacterized protein n=1 Tax=Arabis alpina TaxID=50452 RepID=A0A087HSF0_ARAAL|nr:hypothetical protein AALP_AA1G337700 [Arabis alpina]